MFFVSSLRFDSFNVSIFCSVSINIYVNRNKSVLITLKWLKIVVQKFFQLCIFDSLSIVDITVPYITVYC